MTNVLEELRDYLHLVQISYKAKRYTIFCFFIALAVLKFIFLVKISSVIFVMLALYLLTSYAFGFTVHAAMDTESAEKQILVQSLINIFYISIIVRYLGASEWIGGMIYIFEIIYANIILSRKKGMMIAGASFIAFSVLDMLEYYLILPHLVMFSKNLLVIRDSSYRIFNTSLIGIIFFFVAYSSGIFTKILKEKAKQLRQANEELKELNEQKTYFVANVSHELKEPIAATLFNLENLIDGLMGQLSEKQIGILKVCRKVLLRLSRLAADLLELSKIEAGKMKLKRELINTNEFIDEVMISLAVLAQNKNITLKKNVCEGLPNFWGDKDKLNEALFNLIDNAIKYSPNDSIVDIAVSEEGEDLKFVVEDKSRGIEAQDIPKLFNRYERLFEEKESGSGLGLTITKEIIELHRGRIWVESEVNKGSRFIFKVPKDLRARDNG